MKESVVVEGIRASAFPAMKLYGVPANASIFYDSRLLLRKAVFSANREHHVVDVVNSESSCQRLIQRVERLDKLVDPFAFQLGAYDIEVNPKCS